MRYLLSLALVAFLAMPCYAAFSGAEQGAPGGFSGPISGANVETVAAAKKLPDDARVILVGNIISKLAGSKNKYMFRDGTGEIVVEIKRKVFRGQDITPQDKVRIAGKMDKDFFEPEIEVEVKDLEVVK